MRNKLILEELNSTPGDLIYKGKNIRIYVDDAIIYASGDNYFKKWYFGHYHDYRQVNSQFVLLYEDIVPLEFKSIF